MKEFAPEYSRNPEGWVKFPQDAEYRKHMFPEEVNKHQAKANVYLIQSIIEYVSDEGQTLLDPMSGTGTLMVGALVGRDVICVEISEMFHNLQRQALAKLETIAPGVEDHIMLINLPCQQYLPIPEMVDHIIFSPPYADIMKKSKNLDKMSADVLGNVAWEYSQSPLNLGIMNDFLWEREMKKIYSKCLTTLKPGGTLTLIVKDHYEKQPNGERLRIPLSKSAFNTCLEVGFIEHSWHKWAAPGSAFTSIYRSRGWDTVDDEDIIVIKKGD